MKKIINAKICQSGNLCRLIDSKENTLFSGNIIRIIEKDDNLRLFVLSDDNCNNCTFVEDSSKKTIWSGPKNVNQIFLKEDYILFKRGEQWWKQKYAQKFPQLLGMAVFFSEDRKKCNLFECALAKEKYITILSEKSVIQYKVNFSTKVTLLGFRKEYLLFETDKKYFLYNEDGKYILTLPPYLFLTTKNSNGYILCYNYVHRCYNLVYSGVFLQSYKINNEQSYQWDSIDKFIVPDKEHNDCGTLYEIIKGTAKKIDMGKFRFEYEDFSVKAQKVIVINGKSHKI